MWRLLLQAGLGFATLDVGLRIASFKRKVILLSAGGVVALLGLMALTASAAIALAPRLGAAGAFALVGVVLLIVAAIVVWIGGRRPRSRTPIAGGMAMPLAAAGSAVSSARSSSRAADAADDAALRRRPRRRRQVAWGMMVLATVAGAVLGRRL
jgi:hypothetical protein